MKKMIALLMALVLVFAMTACSSAPEILGTYETTIDMTDLIVIPFDGGAGVTGTDLSLANYMEAFSFIMVSEFNEDGTYRQYKDTASLETAMDNLKDALLRFTDDLLLYSLTEQFASYGYDIKSREAVEEMLDMEWDSIFSYIYGIDLEEFVGELTDVLSEELLNETDRLLQEGKYKAEDGKLYLSTSIDEEIDESAYKTYEIDGDAVSITGGVNIEENEYLSYPFTMTKVSE